MCDSVPVGENGRITVFLLEDQEVVRRGLHRLFAGAAGIEVVGEATTGSAALARIPLVRPDVAVLTMSPPDVSGAEVCRGVRLARPEVACLVLAPYLDDEALLEAIRAGAVGCVLRGIRDADLLDAVRRVAAGEWLLDAAWTAHAVRRLCPRDSGAPAGDGGGRPPGLTERERRILVLLGDGLSNREIGERLGLAEKTVKNYVSGLLAKLGMARRTQAAVYAARMNLPHSPTDGSDVP
ncbi:LuxR family transcriptional regulator [Wenjunlia vitaminophila]|uniref:LuxR family transcriptional regulator n=1 Tax=Wenjunlia vitaminophila TaxID=76728 RepID=A0A0T6LMV0_WENVI|nr:LuxR family transcriptional regulator [Wenjunlia vitaminophila]